MSIQMPTSFSAPPTGFFTSLFNGAKALLQKLLPSSFFQTAPSPTESLRKVITGGRPALPTQAAISRFDNGHRPQLTPVQPGEHPAPLTGQALRDKLAVVARFDGNRPLTMLSTPVVAEDLPLTATQPYPAPQTLPGAYATAPDASVAVDTIPPLTNAVTVSGYDIISGISEGGYGTVYKARSQATGDIVAIKVFKTPSPLIEREYQFTQLGGHIVQAFELTQTTDGRACIVFEYLSGGTLENRFNRLHTFAEAAKALGSPSLAAEVTTSMKDLLVQLAHCTSSIAGMGIVHRDLKPINLLLDSAGTLKLIDMGFSHLSHERLNQYPMSPTFTPVGDMLVKSGDMYLHQEGVWTDTGWYVTKNLGLPSYLLQKLPTSQEAAPLPEVDALFSSPSINLSEQNMTSDVYSLGMMVAYAIMGSKDLADLDAWIASPTVVRHFCEEWGFSPDLANFILKATNPDFTHRYPSNVEAGSALINALASTVHASSTRQHPNDFMYDTVPYALGRLLGNTPNANKATPPVIQPRATPRVTDDSTGRVSRYWGDLGRYEVSGITEERVDLRTSRPNIRVN